ncbi:MAG: hypothetical protein LJE64_00970 [Desulfofustis sp.]|nr:hypothetical protein [Desulfofustis sp.]
MSGEKKIKLKFKFKGYDDEGPIILDNENNRLQPTDGPPPSEVKEENLMMQVYSYNPTCIYIPAYRRWYCR